MLPGSEEIFCVPPHMLISSFDVLIMSAEAAVLLREN
jgi:hypothetical protein